MLHSPQFDLPNHSDHQNNQQFHFFLLQFQLGMIYFLLFFIFLVYGALRKGSDWCKGREDRIRSFTGKLVYRPTDIRPRFFISDLLFPI